MAERPFRGDGGQVEPLNRLERRPTKSILDVGPHPPRPSVLARLFEGPGRFGAETGLDNSAPLVPPISFPVDVLAASQAQ